MADVKKIDVTTRSSYFLALLVYNHEELLLLKDDPLFEDYLRKFYIFTDKQLEILREIMKNDTW